MITSGEGGAILTDSYELNSYVKSYSDHGHKLEKNIPRGLDEGVMPGFNYRMTELQAAVGKVQLKKLNRILAANEDRYKILKKELSKKSSIRNEQIHSTGSYDTFMFSLENESQKERIINILNKFNIGTKNVPDAIKWHCSYFWKHLIDDQDKNNSEDSFKKLSNYIAIPISLRVSEEKYYEIAKNILNVI